MASNSTDPDDVNALQEQIAELQARLATAQQANVNGSGAAAQDGGVALGERSVQTRDNYAPIVTGTQIVHHYYAASDQRLRKEDIARQVVGYLAWLQGR